MDLSSLTKLSNSINLFQGMRQRALGTAAARLSSGLRINSATDDPSGLAISETMRARTNGLEQGQHSIQDANNALTVAEGAMQTISSILQRMRSLVVQANTDLNSAANLQDIQHELDQLRLQIDAISSKTQFNGKNLLDGSLSSTTPKAAHILFSDNPPLASSKTGNNPAGTPLFDPTLTFLNPSAQTVTIKMTVDSYDSTTVPPTLNCTVIASSPDPSFGPDQTSQFAVDAGTNNIDLGGGVVFPPPIGITDQNSNPVIDVQFNPLYQEDVGASATLVTVPGQTKVPGQALQANVGRTEGDIVGVEVPAVNSNNLAVNQITVTQNSLQTVSSEYRIDYAIDTLGANRAQVGANIVAMQNAGENAAIDQNNTTSSESQIRDANIAAEQTAFIKDQILNSLDTSVLNQVNTAATDVKLLLDSTRVA